MRLATASLVVLILIPTAARPDEDVDKLLIERNTKRLAEAVADPAKEKMFFDVLQGLNALPLSKNSNGRFQILQKVADDTIKSLEKPPSKERAKYFRTCLYEMVCRMPPKEIDAKYVKHLIDFVADPTLLDESSRLWTVMHFGTIGANAKEAIPTLKKIASDEKSSDQLASCAVIAIKRIEKDGKK